MGAVTKRAAFAALHARDGLFVLANAWDVGSARLLAARGAEAIGTSSAGAAFAQGLSDGALSLEATLAHAVELDRATPLPVSVDLENGFADAPDGVAEAAKRAADAGLAGASIEDLGPRRADKAARAYGFDLALARIRAAAAVTREARAEGFRLTARADGLLSGDYDFDEALRRLRAFQEAGADVLYAPGLAEPDQLFRLCRELRAPVNALAGGVFLEFDRRDFARAGVRRVSLGSSLARHVFRALDRAARAALEEGDFSAMREGMGFEELEALLQAGRDPARDGEAGADHA